MFTADTPSLLVMMTRKMVSATTSKTADFLPPPPPEDKRLFLHPSLGVEEMKGKGRGVVARSPIPAGTLVARERAVASSVIRIPGVCTRCAAAFARPLVSCPKCKAEYCSQECWEEEQRRVHWIDCTPRYFHPALRVALHTLLSAPPQLRPILTGPAAIELSDDLEAVLENDEAYYHLIGSLQVNLSAEDAEKIVSMFRFNFNGWSSKEMMRQRAYLRHIVQVSRSNCFSLSYLKPSAAFTNYPRLRLPAQITRGTGFFPAVSLFNHACNPNAYWITADGDAILVRTVRDVAAGEELCLNYATNLFSQATPARQHRLQEVWHFTCSCETCDSPTLRRREAESWGFSCRSCGGPAPLSGCAKLLNEDHLARLAGWWPWRVSEEEKELRPKCVDCGHTWQLTETEGKDYLCLLKRKKIGIDTESRHRPPTDTDRRLVAALHPNNKQRLTLKLRESMLGCLEADTLSSECLAELRAVLAAKEAILGKSHLSMAIDKVYYAHWIRRLTQRTKEAEATAAEFHADALAIYARHYGPDSVFARQTLA